MNASHGFFIVKSSDMAMLQAALESHKSISSLKPDGENLIAYLKEPMEASEINKYLFDKGITLSHLIKRKESLEEQFLELTKQN
jgi:ABC-2 type transport system ATP-binding protein